MNLANEQPEHTSINKGKLELIPWASEFIKDKPTAYSEHINARRLNTSKNV
jgi:hypothetical protein